MKLYFMSQSVLRVVLVLTLSAPFFPQRAIIAAQGTTEASAGPIDEQTTAVGKQFFELIDLETPGLGKVRKLVQSSDYSAALDAYRDVLLDSLRTRDYGELINHWGGVSEADEMLKGMVRIQRHAGGVSRNQIGLPGAINWIKPTVDEILDEPPNVEPAARESSNRDWSTHLSSMHHMGSLVAAFAKTHDAKNATFWLRTWEDFVLHQKEAVNRADQKQYNALKASWGVLFVAWRMENFWVGLNALAKELPSDARAALPGPALARVLIFMSTDYAAVQVERLKNGSGAPNQFATAATCLMMEALGFMGGRQCPQWKEETVKFVSKYYRSINLPDGTNFEQAVNYNKGNPDLAIRMLRMYPQRPAWIEQSLPSARQSMLYIAAVIRNGSHHGALTRMGQDDRMEDERLRGFLKYLPDENVERILNHVYGDGRLPQPAFTSIAFPYSGYYVMRTGWGKNDAYSFFKASRRPRGHARNDNTAIHFICAYGRDLLVDGGSRTYGEHWINPYLISSFSKNTVQVDGKGQDAKQMGQGDRGPNTTADEPIANRWSTSARFDFAEGFYASGYEDPKIMVRHERQLIFLREAQIWIVTDRIRGESRKMPATETHSYTQTWKFPEDFEENQVCFDSATGVIRTTDPKGPNVSLRHFGLSTIEYLKYYGQEKPARGWIRVSGIAPLKAVDIHANWNGSGEQLLVTLIVPAKDTADRIKSVSATARNNERSVCGFTAELTDGTRIAYQAALNTALLQTETLQAEASALLTVKPTHGAVGGIVLDGKAVRCENAEQPINQSALSAFYSR